MQPYRAITVNGLLYVRSSQLINSQNDGNFQNSFSISYSKDTFLPKLVLISSNWEVIDIKYEVKRVIVRQYCGCLAWIFPLLSSSRRLFTCIRGKFGDGDASLENRPAYLCQTNTPWQPVSPHRSSLPRRHAQPESCHQFTSTSQLQKSTDA